MVDPAEPRAAPSGQDPLTADDPEGSVSVRAVSPSFDVIGSRQPEDAVLEATRALLWIDTPVDAAALARDLVEHLGASLVPARISSHDAIPVDLSFGVGEPLLPDAPQASVARMLLERCLPAFVADANRAIELTEQKSRLAEDATIDPLTGLATRRMLGRAIGRLRPDDTVIMIDLDHFKTINDDLGHHEGDKVLRIFGRTLASTVRAVDRTGRYGGEEFVVILSGGSPNSFLARLRTEWSDARPHPVTFSAGVAPAQPDPRRAIEAADRAMYRAKQYGRDQWQWATREDYLSQDRSAAGAAQTESATATITTSTNRDKGIVRLNVDLDRALHLKLKQLAHRLNRSVAELVRELIEQAVSRHLSG